MKESKSILDEVFIRISLQNRELFLIIINVSGAGALQVGHDPGNGRYAGVREKERTVVGAVLSLFLFHKNYTGIEQDGQDKSVLFLFKC